MEAEKMALEAMRAWMILDLVIWCGESPESLRDELQNKS